MAERQHGLITREQLRAVGFGRGAIDHRIARRRLHPVRRGVYAVGHSRLSREAAWLAAVLAAGPGAALSHRSAARLEVVISWEFARPEVTVPTRRRAGRGVEVHVARLEADEVTTTDGIPVTTASRTLLDLAAVLPRPGLERALREAEYRGLGDAASLEVLLDRHPRRRGTATLRSLIADGRTGEGVTRSELEERFLAFLDAEPLPRPRLNAHVAAGDRLIECDCSWPAARLVVELDGYAAHGRRSSFERDRARDRALVAAGWRVVRVTWQQLEHEAATVAADLQSALRT